MNISIVVLAHGHPEISNLLAVLASGRTCTVHAFGSVLEVWEFGSFALPSPKRSATSRDFSRFFASVAVSCMCVLLHPSHTTTSHSDVSHSRFIKKEMQEMDRLSEINEINGPFIKK